MYNTRKLPIQMFTAFTQTITKILKVKSTIFSERFKIGRKCNGSG